MSIEVVINGYFRSGTTILWHLLRQAHNNAIHLYEPFLPELKHRLKRFKGKPDPLHKIPLWDDYFKLEGRVLNEILNVSSLLDGSPVTWDEIRHIIALLDNLDEPVYIKDVRLHNVLANILQHTNARVYHIIRCPACVWLSHFTADELTNPDTVFGINKTFNYRHRFYLLNTFNKLKQIAPIRIKVFNWLDIFTYNWVISNYFALDGYLDFLKHNIWIYELITPTDLVHEFNIPENIAYSFKPMHTNTWHNMILQQIRTTITTTTLYELYKAIDYCTNIDYYYSIL